MDLNLLVAFTTVAELDSYTLAAKKLHCTKSKISRQISELESVLKVQLFVRTTRQINLTPLGQVYLQRCAPLIDELLKADQVIYDQQQEPHGNRGEDAPE